ncbi:MAG: hypothetical protein MZV70_57935 [Desulfobacterales bacterium]|nr:hypothetical protein [Desulfobacterales bacterium]
MRSITNDIEQGKGTLGMLAKDGTLYVEVKDTFTNFKEITDGIKKGEGTLGKLAKDDSLYLETEKDVEKRCRRERKAFRRWHPLQYWEQYLDSFFNVQNPHPYFLLFSFACYIVCYSGPSLGSLTMKSDSWDPLFHIRTRTIQTISPLDLFWPSYDSNEGGYIIFFILLGHARKDHSYFIPFYRSKQFDEDSDTSLTLFFWGKSKKQGSYGGVFPFYGKLYDRFAKDEMGFSCGPYIASQEPDNATKTNIYHGQYSRLYDGARDRF